MRKQQYKSSIITKEWYNIEDLINKYPSAVYYMVFGERKNGKTYSAKKYILQCVQEGRTFMYVRRTHKMITKRKVSKLFDDMQDVCIEKTGSKMLYNGQGEFQINSDTEPVTVGYCTSIEEAFLDKGIPFNSVKYILFDEFLDYWYREDEIEMFLHTIANIVRDEEQQGVKIIMLGNTTSMTCPYFDYFGIDPKKIKRGVKYFFVNEKGGRIAVEYTKSRAVLEDGVKKSKYFGFGNTESNMITSGEWESVGCETKSIDGIGWSAKRKRIPLYITGQGQCFEMSYTNTQYPVAFVRVPNIQKGQVNSDIKFNLAFDKTVHCWNNKTDIPTFRKTSSLFGEGINAELNIIEECLSNGRIVFDSELTGTVFRKMFEVVK